MAAPRVQRSGERVHGRRHEVVAGKDLLGRLRKACTILECTIVKVLVCQLLVVAWGRKWLLLGRVVLIEAIVVSSSNAAHNLLTWRTEHTSCRRLMSIGI